MPDSSPGPGRAELAVETVDLRREYRARRGPAVTALDGVSIAVEQGEVHGLLGPNGAGKSTLMKILSTVLLPSSGSARILGHDLAADYKRIRPLLGIVFGGERGLYPRLTARQNLRYWAALYRMSGTAGRARTEELLDEFGLAERADERVETYSVGMRQRLHLARGLLADPRVVLLDEPTNGLDPLAARQLRELIGRLAGEGRTVLLATHDLDEAEVLCDRVTMINHGQVVAAEAPRTLARLVSQQDRIRITAAGPVLDRVRELPGVARVVPAEDGAAVISVDSKEAVGRVLAFVVSAGVTEVRTELPSLEEVYLQLVHRNEERSVVAR
ncbi:ABC transporter ATP-binding protein [Streptacidiphilus sp. PB12-B1b]|uniref:ABC transporter ATP-binding protein n=1 Tax=Streptacidiphilus sp. PB12-B1b TaxID=2705012 RepID=UPI0015FE10DA|nr:ABC transporter ATP-binding protein [Streptacidiphilus sp. PB12-B1b]QMU77882.1 ABC transporter ATP-binding protein [Streptacidiphilus sp. PB12-B1b]